MQSLFVLSKVNRVVSTHAAAAVKLTAVFDYQHGGPDVGQNTPSRANIDPPGSRDIS